MPDRCLYDTRFFVEYSPTSSVHYASEATVTLTQADPAHLGAITKNGSGPVFAAA
jgi:hypothetical protein